MKRILFFAVSLLLVIATFLFENKVVGKEIVKSKYVFLDLGFYLPHGWKIQNDITAVQNLKGDTIAFTMDLIEPKSNALLHIQFYKSPNAQIIFDDKQAKFNNKSSGIETIELLGQKSFISKEIRKYNGKGQKTDNETAVYILYFKHPKKIALFELQYSFKVRASCVKEDETFKKLVQSLSLIN